VTRRVRECRECKVVTLPREVATRVGNSGGVCELLSRRAASAGSSESRGFVRRVLEVRLAPVAPRDSVVVVRGMGTLTLVVSKGGQAGSFETL
jgi:hypothetical protein